MLRLIIILASIVTTAASPVATPPTHPPVTLRAILPDAPEGVVFAPDGRLYATLYSSGAVVEILADGGFREVASISGTGGRGIGVAVGLAADLEGMLYVAYRQASRFDDQDYTDPTHPSCRDATVQDSGVYRIDPRDGSVSAVMTRAQGWPVCFPNDIAVDRGGGLYISDLIAGVIWRIGKDKQPVIWSADPLLSWAPAPWAIAPFGVNAIELSKDYKSLLVGTVGNPMIIRFPIKIDGTVGMPVIVQRDGGPNDGLAIAEDGTIYTSEIMRNEIWAMTQDGTQRYLVATKATAPLDGNASLALLGKRLCVANIGFPKINREDMDRTVICFDLSD